MLTAWLLDWSNFRLGPLISAGPTYRRYSIGAPESEGES